MSLPGSLLLRCTSSSNPMVELSHFAADVTPPLGHGLLAGVIAPAREIVDPLFVHGVVLSGAGLPVVIAGVDWCEIRNDAHERWRTVLAEAAGTAPERVLVSSLHQHDTPVMDLEAQRLLDRQGLQGLFCDPDFHDKALGRVADALRDSLASARGVTHIGTGQARVEKVASSRRIETPDGRVSFDRSAIVRDPELRALPEGLVDPWLKTLSFWSGDEPLAAISCFAVHPITYYGQGQVSSDYVGMARARRQQDLPGVAQIYLTGCAGDVTAGKYNDGDPANRPVLAERVYSAMREAWAATEKRPIERCDPRNVSLDLPLRSSPGFTQEDQQEELRDPALPAPTRALAATGLSWWKRYNEGKRLDIPVVDFGFARLLLLPGETFVQYQLWAQQMRPDLFVVAVGYGDSAPGYIPTRQATADGFDQRRRSIKTWMWADPERSEEAMLAAITEAMEVEGALGNWRLKATPLPRESRPREG
jgi:hypothetical protein